MSENLDKIKERIAKLLRMAADTASPEEAAIAAGRARKLMDSYQLSEVDVSGDSLKEQFGEAVGSAVFKKFPTYMSTLAVAVARYNDCHAFLADGVQNGVWGQQIKFRGYVTDVNLAVEMFKRLLGAAHKQAMTHIKLNHGKSEYDATLGNHFKIGFCTTLIPRLRAMTVERDQIQTATGTALVVMKAKAVEAHYGRPSYSKAEYKSARDAAARHARAAGYQAGSTVEIRKAID